MESDGRVDGGWSGGEMVDGIRLERMAEMMVELFGEQRDCVAVQQADGSYWCVRQEWGPAEVAEHLLGRRTMAVYPVRMDLDGVGIGRWLCHDLDGGVDSIEELEALLSVYADLGLAEAVQGEFSGRKGFHVWVFGPPMPAALLGRLGRHAASLAGVESAELFPKQTRLSGNRVGNPVKLPLGVHQVTGKRCLFADGPEGPIALADSLAVLEGLLAGRVTEEQVRAVLPPVPRSRRRTGANSAGSYNQQLVRFVESQRACVALAERGVEAGRRHDAALLLLVSYRRRGWSREAAVTKLLSVDRRNQPPLADEEGERWAEGQARYVYARDQYRITCYWSVIREAGWCSPECPLYPFIFASKTNNRVRPPVPSGR